MSQLYLCSAWMRFHWNSFQWLILQHCVEDGKIEVKECSSSPIAVSKRVKHAGENVYNVLPLRVEKVLEYFSLFTAIYSLSSPESVQSHKCGEASLLISS